MQYRRLISTSLRCVTWLVFQFVFTRLQRVSWWYHGIGAHRRNVERQHKSKNDGGGDYRPVHVQRILYRYKLDHVVQSASFVDFVTAHVGFYPVNYLLQQNISLYCLNKREAAFVECAPNIDVTSSKHSSFLRIAQFKLAINFIVVPIDVLHQLADEIGDPQKKLVFLANTSRCGSTLLTQIFEETGRITAFSEPDAMFNLIRLEPTITEDEMTELMRSTIRVVCKDTSPTLDAFVIKISQPAIGIVPRLMHLFPASKHLFMYRDGLPVARSIAKLVRSVPQTDFFMTLAEYSFCVRWAKTVVNILGFPIPGLNELPNTISDLYIGTHVWAVTIDYYMKFRRRGLNIVAVKYEHIVDTPEYAVRKLFDYCEFDYDINAVRRAFERDSQENSPLSRAVLSQFKSTTPINQDLLTQLDALCVKYQAPPVTSSESIEGTITLQNGVAHKHLPKASTNGYHVYRKYKDRSGYDILNGVTSEACEAGKSVTSLDTS